MERGKRKTMENWRDNEICRVKWVTWSESDTFVRDKRAFCEVESDIQGPLAKRNFSIDVREKQQQKCPKTARQGRDKIRAKNELNS